MKTHIRWPVVAAIGLLALAIPGQLAYAQHRTSKDFVPPIVFQAAGPTAESIQSAVDEFRAALA